MILTFLWDWTDIQNYTKYHIKPWIESYQRHQFWVVDKIKLSDEVVVVFVARVDVRLCSHAADTVKVVNVNMNKHPEETTQDLLTHLPEIFWKWDT